jgi:hypothetical protein
VIACLAVSEFTAHASLHWQAMQSAAVDLPSIPALLTAVKSAPALAMNNLAAVAKILLLVVGMLAQAAWTAVTLTLDIITAWCWLLMSAALRLVEETRAWATQSLHTAWSAIWALCILAVVAYIVFIILLLLARLTVRVSTSKLYRQVVRPLFSNGWDLLRRLPAAVGLQRQPRRAGQPSDSDRTRGPQAPAPTTTTTTTRGASTRASASPQSSSQVSAGEPPAVTTRASVPGHNQGNQVGHKHETAPKGRASKKACHSSSKQMATATAGPVNATGAAIGSSSCCQVTTASRTRGKGVHSDATRGSAAGRTGENGGSSAGSSSGTNTRAGTTATTTTAPTTGHDASAAPHPHTSPPRTECTFVAGSVPASPLSTTTSSSTSSSTGTPSSSSSDSPGSSPLTASPTRPCNTPARGDSTGNRGKVGGSASARAASQAGQGSRSCIDKEDECRICLDNSIEVCMIM